MRSIVRQKVHQFFSGYPIMEYEPDTILLRPQEKSSFVYYILEGRVDEYDISPVGNEVIINTFQTPAFFPVSLAINEVENLYFFEVSHRMKAHVAPARDVVKFLKLNPDVTFELLQRVYRGTDGVLRRMAHLMGGRSRSRLIFELLNAAARLGVENSNGTIMLTLTENDFAKRTGLSRETVSRMMQELKRDGFVTVQTHGITILDKHKLEESIGANL